MRSAGNTLPRRERCHTTRCTLSACMRGATACRVSPRRPIPLVIKASCRVLRLIMEVLEARDHTNASSIQRCGPRGCGPQEHLRRDCHDRSRAFPMRRAGGSSCGIEARRQSCFCRACLRLMAGTHHKRELAKHPDTMRAILEDLKAVIGSADRGMEALDTVARPSKHARATQRKSTAVEGAACSLPINAVIYRLF